MDKNSIKKFAQYARSKLIPEMEKLVEMWDKAMVVSGGISVGGDIFNDKPYLHYGKAHESLKREINRKGKKELAEQAAYIWFNRIVALRYMEMHNYLPTRSSFFESSDGSGSPDIVTRALDEYQTTGIDKETVFDLYGKKNKELYAQLFISMCNTLSKEYGFMFGKLDDWTSLLFPISLLDTNGIIKDENNGLLSIPDESWDEVEIIGWVYQYYISERKDELINASKKENKKFGKKEIGSVTQIFTPKWIVKYMVQNTVGKTRLQNYPDLELQKKWEFYIEGGSDEYINITDPTELTLLDPACGSGHILVVGFELLYEIYKKAGYSPKQIPQKIIENNLYGFEIDERAHQLACFAILMKAKQYDEEIQNKVDVTNHIICIGENNNFEKVDEKKYPHLREFLKLWHNGKVYGSLMKMDEVKIDEEKILNEFTEFEKERGLLDYVTNELELKNLIHQYNLMSNKYACVVANPPYMGANNMDDVLKKFINKEYEAYKSDLFSAFIIRNMEYTQVRGKTGYMTPNVWMFISSYENLRKEIILNYGIDSLIQLAKGSFFSEATVDICTFILENYNNPDGVYVRLEEFKGGLDMQEEKFKESCNNDNCSYKYNISKNRFYKLPGLQFGYRISDDLLNVFEKGKSLDSIAYPRQGMATTNNNLFLRQWFEVDLNKIGFKLTDEIQTMNSYKRYPYNKGGDYRKWYGNNDYVVNFANMGEEVCEYIDKHSAVNHTGRVINRDKYFHKSVTWSKISSGTISFRFKENGFIFDVAGTSIFGDDDTLYYLIGFLNSKITVHILNVLSPTLNYEVGHICSIPIIDCENKDKILDLVRKNIIISKNDWDAFETSWNFLMHPIIKFKGETAEESFENWVSFCEDNFKILKNNEEELNRIFNNIYGLQEIDPSVDDKEIVVGKYNRGEDIKSLLSYVIGCLMGRYSLDQEGLVYAGGKFDPSKYKTFEADDDGIIPVLYDSYFTDDVVDCTKEFIKTVRGKENFDENRVRLAQSLGEGSSKSADEIIRNYYNKSFMEDHFNTYQKRPIYRYFVSNSKKPKESAFKCIVYLHRYNKDTISIIRSKYLHKFQSKLEEELARLSKEDSRAAEKRCDEIRKQLLELGDYDKLLKDFADKNIELDLDDGVKVNYTKLMDAGIVAKLKI